MSKTKNKTGNEVRHLIGEIKRLRKENNQLKRLLEKANRPVIYELPEEPVIEMPTCKECNKGRLTTLDFLGRVFQVCETCGDRKKVK